MKYTTQHITDMITCAESKLAAASTVAWKRENFGLYGLTDALCHIFQLKLYLFLLRRFRNVPGLTNFTTEEDLSHIFDRIKRMPYPCDLVVDQPPVVIVNQPPSASAGVDQNLAIGTTSALLAGTASDPEGQPLVIQWTKVSGGNATINSPFSLITSVTNMQTGTYIFQLTVIDNKGATASDIVLITIAQALDKIFYGRSDNILTTDPEALETLILSSDWLNRNGANDVTIAWYVGQTLPQYCWVAIPNRTADHNKNKWYVDVVNQGNIGSVTDLFGAPTTVMINTGSGDIEYLLWQSNYQTQFSTVCLFKKV